MHRVILSLIENCSIEFERNEKGWRLRGSGPFGVIGLLLFLFFLGQFANALHQLLS